MMNEEEVDDLQIFSTRVTHFQVNKFGKDNPLTALKVVLKDVDPDDAFSSVPYEKGSCFLFYLEQLLGGPGKSDNKCYVFC